MSIGKLLGRLSSKVSSVTSNFKNSFKGKEKTPTKKTETVTDCSSSATQSPSIEVAIKEGNLQDFENKLRQVDNIKLLNLPLSGKGANTLLHLAAALGQPEMVVRLIKAGVDVDQANARGERPLHLASQQGSIEMINALLAAGANVNVANARGERPLHFAAVSGDPNLIGRLIEGGAVLSVRDKEGNSPLHLAAIHGHEKVVGFLVEQLYARCLQKSEKALPSGNAFKELSEYVCMQNVKGETALHLAVAEDKKFSAYALVRGVYGWVDLTEVKNEFGQTPLDFVSGTDFEKDLRVLARSGDKSEKNILENEAVSEDLKRFLESIF